MIAPFDKKYTDYIIVAVSVVPILAQVLLSGIGATALCANWIASGLFAWMIWNIIEVNHLGIFKRNHAFPISWALISMVLNFALINFNEYKDGTLAAERWYDIDKFQWYYLIQMLGLLLIIMTMMQTWQNKIATLPLIFCGLITGAVSTLLNYSLFWLLFFPVILYQLRSLSKQNLGSILTGVVLAIWLCYVGRFFLFGIDNADQHFLSYTKILDHLIPDYIDYTRWEWVFIGYIAILIIIYSIAGLTNNVANSVKAYSSIIMLSILSFIITIIAIIDISHLENYLGIIAILLSFQVSIHQSYINSAKNEWWTITIIAGLAILSIVSLFSFIF